MPLSRLLAPAPVADFAPAPRGFAAGGDPLGEALAARFGRVGGDMPFVGADPLADRRRPAAVAVPDGYEPGYAYPLVVWLHDVGASEHTVHSTLRGVSERNYLGLAVRGAACGGAGGSGFGWPDRAVADLAARLPGLVAAVGSEWNVHTERVYLAGLGAGADAAADLLAARPDWFAGAALVAGGTLPPAGPVDGAGGEAGAAVRRFGPAGRPRGPRRRGRLADRRGRRRGPPDGRRPGRRHHPAGPRPLADGGGRGRACEVLSEVG